MRGYDTHGINRLPQIIEGFENKTIFPKAKPKIIKDNVSTAVINGNYCLGYPLGIIAMKLAVEKAKKQE